MRARVPWCVVVGVELVVAVVLCSLEGGVVQVLDVRALIRGRTIRRVHHVCADVIVVDEDGYVYWI